MQGHLSKRDFESVTQLSTLLSRVQQLQRRATELEGDVSEIETSLKGINGKSSPQKVAELIPQLIGNESASFEAGRGGPPRPRVEGGLGGPGGAHGKEKKFPPSARG